MESRGSTSLRWTPNSGEINGEETGKHVEAGRRQGRIVKREDKPTQNHGNKFEVDVRGAIGRWNKPGVSKRPMPMMAAGGKNTRERMAGRSWPDVTLL